MKNQSLLIILIMKSHKYLRLQVVVIMIVGFGFTAINYAQTKRPSHNELKNLLNSSHVHQYLYNIVNVYPHNPQHFTQGLVLHGQEIYESCGLYGHSKLVRFALKNGQIIQKKLIPNHYFAEGITLFDKLLFQLTYRSQTGFVYAFPSLNLLKTFSYEGEGWGLTNNGKQLIKSDGSATLTFIDPKTLKPTHQQLVHIGITPISGLNDLEYAKGTIYANIWLTAIVVMIDANTGNVHGWIDLSRLQPSNQNQNTVTNGIAYDSVDHSLIVTGKFWPKLYRIKLRPCHQL